MESSSHREESLGGRVLGSSHVRAVSLDKVDKHEPIPSRS